MCGGGGCGGDWGAGRCGSGWRRVGDVVEWGGWGRKIKSGKDYCGQHRKAVAQVCEGGCRLG